MGNGDVPTSACLDIESYQRLVKFLDLSLGAFAFLASGVAAAGPTTTAGATRPMTKSRTATTAAELTPLGRPRLVYRKGTAIQFLSVQFLDSGVHICFRGQFYKCKPARSSQFHIAHDLDARGLDLQACAELI